MVQVVTKKESGTRCIGEARVTQGEAWESGPEVCGRVWQSTRECGRAQESAAEHERVWQSMRERSRA
jgi:hypothetical protein